MRNSIDTSLARTRHSVGDSTALTRTRCGRGKRKRSRFFWPRAALAGLALAACSLEGREIGQADPSLFPGPNGAADGGTECMPGETSCLSATEAVQCEVNRAWGQPVPCASGCVDGACQTGECAAGTAECLSITLVHRCSVGGQWSDPEECEFACVGSDCGGACKPGETRCGSETSVETCSAEGQWGAPTACTGACSGNACIGECSEGDARCASSTQEQSCNELGQWVTPVSCLNACVGSACGGECVPGSGRCNTETGLPQGCSMEGAWQDREACPFVCTGDGQCTGECTPGDGQCSASGLPQICSSEGVWTNEPACEFVCMGAGSCAGECSNGSRRCNPVSAAPQLCSDGIWQNQPTCQFVCSNGFCSGECTPNSRRCNPLNGRPQLCSAAGLWQDQTPCPFVCSSGACSGECVPTERRCNPTTNVPQLCGGAGTFQNQAACGLRTACSSTTGTCQALPNPFSCNNANPPPTTLPFDLFPRDANGGVVFPPGAPPAAAGGTLRNGRYSPTRIDVYGQAADPAFVTYEMTFEFRDGFAQAGYRAFVGTGAVLASDEVEFVGTVTPSGTSLAFDVDSCATGACTSFTGISCDLPASVRYTATANGLITFLASGPTTIVTTYARQ
jgi:hypothetical protein